MNEWMNEWIWMIRWMNERLTLSRSIKKHKPVLCPDEEVDAPQCSTQDLRVEPLLVFPKIEIIISYDTNINTIIHIYLQVCKKLAIQLTITLQNRIFTLRNEKGGWFNVGSLFSWALAQVYDLVHVTIVACGYFELLYYAAFYALQGGFIIHYLCGPAYFVKTSV